MWFYLIVSTLAWGIAEIFYKLGNAKEEKYSHLKSTIFVGLFFGIYGFINLFVSGIDIASFPINFLRYLPVALCYIVSMTCSYFGVRFIEESIADPIENTSVAIVPILCAIFLKETYELEVVLSIVLVLIGLILISVFDKKGKEDRTARLGKKLGIIAFAMPFCYMMFDAVGTFLDIFYTDSVETTFLVHVTEANLESTANSAYMLTFFLVGVFLYIYLRAKGERLFKVNKTNSNQKWKILAAIFETIGQSTYLFALSSGGAVAAVILGSGTVIVSLVLSRILLKEKLTIVQYMFVGVILLGIVCLSLLGV